MKTSSENKSTYTAFYDAPAKSGETQIIRHPSLAKGPLSTSFDPVHIKTLKDLFERTSTAYPENNFIGTRKHIKDEEFGEYEWIKFKDIKEIIQNYSAAISKLDLCPEKYVEEHKWNFRFLGINSKNRAEWVLSELTGIYDSITMVSVIDLGTIEHVANQTEFTTMVAEESNIDEIAKNIVDKKMPHLKNIILLTVDNSDQHKVKNAILEINKSGVNIFYFNEILQIGKQYKEELLKKSEPVFKKEPSPDDVVIIIFTSGTTGEPKGVMIKHKNFVAGIQMFFLSDANFNENDVSYSYLPFAHLYEQYNLCRSLTFGIAMGLTSGHIQRFFSDLQALKPTMLSTVPRVQERILISIQKKIELFSEEEKKHYEEGLKIKLENYEKTGEVTDEKYDALIFYKFKEIVGGRLRYVGSGSAPALKENLKKFRVIFSIIVVEGYGSTETCGSILQHSCLDNCDVVLGGPPLGCEFKLVDVPELEYFTSNFNSEKNLPEPKGELCVRGPCVFTGYFKNMNLYKEVVDQDGWLHTGDIAVIDYEYGKGIRLIDRKKNIFKLSQGEFVAPDKIQTICRKSKFVKNMCVVGNSLYNFLGAIVVPNEEECYNYLKSKNLENTQEKIFDNEDMNQMIIKDMEKIGRGNGLKGFEIVKKIYLCKEDFTIENNMLTPSMKLKTNEVKKKYKEKIDAFYNIS